MLSQSSHGTDRRVGDRDRPQLTSGKPLRQVDGAGHVSSWWWGAEEQPPMRPLTTRPLMTSFRTQVGQVDESGGDGDVLVDDGTGQNRGGRTASIAPGRR